MLGIHFFLAQNLRASIAEAVRRGALFALIMLKSSQSFVNYMPTPTPRVEKSRFYDLTNLFRLSVEPAFSI